jgi:arylsulfatase A-like enzyme
MKTTKVSNHQTIFYKLIVIIFIFTLSNLNVFAQRNVVLIIADDLGTDYCGFYENYGDTVALPNIRTLLSKGVRFKNAMSNPVCSSTRAGILTGRYSFRTGVGNIVGGIGGSNPLDTSEVTIPLLLKIFNTNIATANIGKWHLHQPMPIGNLLFPNIMGYDHFEGPFIGQLPSYTNWTKYTNGVASTITTYATTENVNNALTWINNQTGKPFFLWLAFNAPHSPYHLPPAGMYSNTSLSGTQQNINTQPKEYFKASLEALDFEIGRLFDSLQTINRLDSTDFIFIGDNGNSTLTAQIADTSRAKGTVYQYGVHVPFIIAGPSILNPGRVSDALVNTADLFATIQELFGNQNWLNHIPLNKPIDSKSLNPILKDTVSSVRDWSFCEIFKLVPDAADGKAIRNTNFKLFNFDDGHQEFYNLSADSLEQNNLLNGVLNPNELANYNYLCTEYSNLLGAGNICSATVGEIEINKFSESIKVYPNPFSSKMQLTYPKTCVKMIDALGNIIYNGCRIGDQDFSKLSSGMFFLILDSPQNKSFDVLKLVKY